MTIFATLVLQGLSLPFLILVLGLRDEGDDTRMAELDARLKAGLEIIILDTDEAIYIVVEISRIVPIKLKHRKIKRAVSKLRLS